MRIPNGGYLPGIDGLPKNGYKVKLMTRDELIERLRNENRSAVARATGISYGYLSKLVYGEIKNPGSTQIDRLRSHFIALDIHRGRPQ